MSNTFLFYLILLCFAPLYVKGQQGDEDVWSHYEGRVVKKDQRRPLVSTEYGEVSAVEISDGERRPYHLQFITLEPNALFLPVLLHADMLFYVRTANKEYQGANEEMEMEDEEELFEINLEAANNISPPPPQSQYYWESYVTATRNIALLANCLLPIDHISSAVPMSDCYGFTLSEPFLPGKLSRFPYFGVVEVEHKGMK